MKENVIGHTVGNDRVNLEASGKVATERLKDFMQRKALIRNECSNEKKPRNFKVKEIRNFIPSFDVNWLTFMNNQLLNDSKLSDESILSIDHPECFKKLVEFMASAEES